MAKQRWARSVGGRVTQLRGVQHVETAKDERGGPQGQPGG